MSEHATIVEVVTGTSMAEIRAGRDRATASLVELRLDGVKDLDVAAALEGRRTPVIITIRAAWEGGFFEGSEDERLSLVAQAIRLGAEYVDVEWKAERRALPSNERTQVVLSHHDFTGFPADSGERVRAMLSERPHIVKLAVHAEKLSDCVRLRDLLDVDHPHVAIAMGTYGHLTRVCPRLFRSLWTFGGANAPGQSTVAELRDLYRVESHSSKTALYGIAGEPLAHSASPAMHNPALAAAGLDAVYVRFETADPDELFAVADAFHVQGASVTAPLKPGAFARVAETDGLAKDIGAINTLKREVKGWHGRNFDVAGFLAPLESRGRSIEGARVVVLGAGGSARTAVWALRSKGARVAVTARRADRARALETEFGVEAVEWPPAPGWDLLVNTTPVGTWPATGEAPLSRDRVRGACVYDLIYNPEETTLLRWAREAGVETIGGLEMLVSQACLQFEWWTGTKAPVTTIANAARAFVVSAQRHERAS